MIDLRELTPADIDRLSYADLCDLEYLRCAGSFWYWLAHHGWLRNERTGEVFGPGLTLWPGQAEYLDAYISLIWLITGKARQVGCTWLASNADAWDMMFHSDIGLGVVGPTDEKAITFLDRVRWIYDQQPPHIARHRPLRGSDNKHALGLSNGSTIRSHPSTSGALRGLTGRRVRCEELAHWQNAGAAWAAIMGAVGDSGGQLAVVSTANGEGGMYYELWQNPRFRQFFFPWHMHPERDQAWYSEMLPVMGPLLMRQEYPATPEEMFISTGDKWFDSAMLAVLQAAQQRDPLRTWQVGGITWSIYAEPQEGRRYVLSADIADGGGDACSADVLDAATGEQVAHLHSYICGADDFAPALFELGKMYNWAFCGPERNNMGAATVAILQRMQYSRLYFHQHYDPQAASMRPRAGWLTDTSSRPVLLNDLRSGLHSASIIVRHAETWAQLRSFGWYHKKWQHPDGGHDDAVISLAIGQQLRQAEMAALAADGPLTVYLGGERL